MERVEEEKYIPWFEKVKCTFPECECKIPDYAFSHDNRIRFCDKFDKAEDKKDD